MRHPENGFGSDKLIGGPIPLYYQLADLMRNNIMEGTYAQGEKLPTENRLTQQYGVSRPTIRKA